MAKNYSSTYHKTVNSLSPAETPLVCLEIDHEDLPEPVRIVNDREDVTIAGATFQKMGFSIVMPDDPESGRPEAKLRVDNIGRELVEWLEIADWSTPTTVRIIQVLRSAPDNIEWEITMGLHNVSISPTIVEGTLTFDDFFGQPAIRLTYNATTAPGLH